MDLDLAQFHDTFFEESFEALDGMEAALLKLDVGSPNPEGINTIFRVAHSIKGGAGMFGFKEVASFTHTLETLLDELRGGRMQVTTHISDKLLVSVDVLREMLRTVQRKETVDMQRVADLQFDLEQIVASKGAAQPGPASLPSDAGLKAAVESGSPPPAVCGPAVLAAVPTAAPGIGAPTSTAPPACAAPWRINFRALPELLIRGNDPLTMFSSLAELGAVTAITDLEALPRVRDIDTERCYLTWQLELASDCKREQIDTVFEWAEGDCEIKMEKLGAGYPAAPRLRLETPPGKGAGPLAFTPAATKQRKAENLEAVKAASAETPKAPGSENTSIRVSTEKV